MRTKEILFKIFLVLYIVVLGIHAKNIDWTVLSGIALLSGVLLAYFAHARKGFVTILLLAVHMTIEWSQHVSVGLSYTTGELIFHGIHALFDIVFLVSEFKRHSHNALKAILAGILVGLLSLLLLGNHKHVETSEETHHAESEEHTEFPFDALIMGGILGCAVTHLFERRR